MMRNNFARSCWPWLMAGLCSAAAPGWLVGGEQAVMKGYHRLGVLPLPGAGKGDFLAFDPVDRRLYVTHADGVQVVDADALKLLGTLSGTPHSHGVAAAEGLGKVYVSSGVPGSVVVFDQKTLKRLREVPSMPDTDVILFDQPSGRVFTFNGDSQDATVIDASTDKVLKTVDLGGGPEVAVSDGKGAIYGNIESTSELIRINSRTLGIERRWPIAPGEAPSGLALDTANHRLFIGCRNKLLVVMDALSGKVLQSLPIGDHIDTTVYDPSTQTVFNSCGDGTLSVIHQDDPDHYRVVENAVTEPGAKTMAFDPKTGRVFLSTAYASDPAQPAAFHLLIMGQ